jgi:hypothetical protein
MSNEYVEITESVGRTLKDRLRAIEWEPLPKQLSDLLGEVLEQDNEEAPRGGSRGFLRRNTRKTR